MVSADVARTVVGVIGNVISFGLFLSPAPTFVSIVKEKSVQGFKADVYVLTIVNCAMWVIYGLPVVHPDSILVLTINGVGLIFEIVYTTIFIIYSDWNKRKRIFIMLVTEAIFLVIVCAITFLRLHTHKARSTLIGVLCIIFNIIMYASPLTAMSRVIRTKSVKYMPFYVSLACFLNATCWTIYALIRFDPNVAVPNGLGSLLAIVQLILYATYYKSTNWDEEEDKPQVELAGTNRSEV